LQKAILRKPKSDLRSNPKCCQYQTSSICEFGQNLGWS
jgi:hypothetical protein